MKSPLMQALDALVRMDAHDARKLRDMADAHLRDLEAGPTRRYDHLPEKPGWWTFKARRLSSTEGAELQRGLEAAVVREQERLDGPDEDYGACEEDKHVGHTTDF